MGSLGDQTNILGFGPKYDFIPAKIGVREDDFVLDTIRTLPELIAYNARVNPEHIFCVQTRKSTEQQSSRSQSVRVTHLQLARAIRKCSEWLVHNVGEIRRPWRDESGAIHKGSPVALLMESDVGIIFHLLAFMKLGVPVVLLSARLSPTTIAHLLNKTSACAIIASPNLQKTASEGLELLRGQDDNFLSLYCPQPYEKFIGDQETPSDTGTNVLVPDPDHYIDQWDRNVIILHSSGTTGLPKPMYTSHAYWIGYATCHAFPDVEAARGLNTTTLPLYHGFGLHCPALSLSIGHTMVLPPPSTVSSGFSTVELLTSTSATSLMTVPIILEEIANLPDEIGVKALQTLKYVAFGGGPLKYAVGKKLAEAGVKLLKNYGLTEVGPLGLIFNPSRGTDWNYFTMRQDLDFKLIKAEGSATENGTYRLTGFPAGWREPLEIQDKLVGNPNNPHEFNPVGRADDLIILNTGEKVMPAILESLLAESSLIKAALAFGDGRFELGILIEPTEPQLPDQYDDFKSKIWPLITEASQKMDNHARILSPYAIIVTPPGKGMLRSDKGSILRRDTIALFEQEVEEVYTLLETDTQGDVAMLDMNHLEQSLRNLLRDGLQWKFSENGWSDEVDFFELGMDSLQATSLRRLILKSIPKNETSLKERIGADFVYRFPSISLMAERLTSKVFTDCNVDPGVNLLHSYVNQYSTRIALSPKAIVVLTGGTGSLGSHLLAHLASLPGVAEIICLNRPRPVDARAFQEQAIASKGIGMSKSAWEKLNVLQTNTSAPILGLQDSEYRIIMGKVTHILHNAWPMDFNRSISSFKNHFETLQNLCNLALDANSIRPKTKPRILLTSSIGVVGKYNTIHGGSEVPEVRVEDAACTNEFGYGQAKLVCERILESFSSQYPDQMEAGYVRIGQISGSTTSGFWNCNEHFPALVKSSQFVGKFPPVKGYLSWLPVDLVAQSMSELLLTPVGYQDCKVFHLQNPVMQPAYEVYDIILSKLGPGCSLAESFEEWIDLVCRAPNKETGSEEGSREEILASNPAAKLNKFFREDFQRMGDVVLGTAQARKFSPTLENMGPVSAETVGRYVDYWRREGFLV
ncbi:hypothetical protein VTL71DRAFT_1917 [Oculimacula yallundae]|uniref:Carrier domain-containing protein n=1 Tax=Oculimacula yallundae TaxID=86028 RepID=A0ABR4CC32_9HELO